MKLIHLILLFPFLSFCQVQIGENLDGQVGSNINGRASNEGCGSVLAISDDGTILATSSPNNYGTGTHWGIVRVFKKLNGDWVQIGDDIIGNQIIVPGLSGNSFGFNISLSGDGSTIAIGAIEENTKFGNIKIFKIINNDWTIIGNITPSGAQLYDIYGRGLDLSFNGTVLAVGSEYHNNSSGQVIVYRNISNTWVAIGQPINGAFRESLGYDVSLSSNGNVLAIGCPGKVLNGFGCGCVKVFQNISNNWIQIGGDINGINSVDYFGRSVDLSSDGTFFVAGAPAFNNFSGQVRSYKIIANNWVQVLNTLDGESNSQFGKNLSLSSNNTTLAISSYGINNSIWSYSGEVKIYRKDVNNNWVFFNSIYGHAPNDLLGSGLSLSADGNFIAVGTPGNDENGNNAGQVSVYDLRVLNNQSFTLNDFSIYPNPTKDIITIALQENLQLEKVNIYSVLGQLIKTENNKIINVTSLSKGFYLMEVITDKGKATRKILVE